MEVFHRVDNEALVREGVLCRVNMHIDQAGIFDLEPDLMKMVIKETGIRPPGSDASKEELFKYALKFNRDVMGHPKVLAFLAEKLARNLHQLGKTIVFAGDIKAANQLADELSRHPGMQNKVAVVHSKIGILRMDGDKTKGRTPEEVIKEFYDRGSDPCILINVKMLTEGFDDPKVRSVMLATLTLSTNLFWQMIGRGTRGLKAGGTRDCFVIDPIKLVRLYDYFSGYQPSVSSELGEAIADDGEEGSLSLLSPKIPLVSQAPLPSETKYTISPHLRQLHGRVAEAIEQFLGGKKLSEAEAIAICHATQIVSEDGGVVVGAQSSAPAGSMGVMVLHESVRRAGVSLNADLFWLENQIPGEPSDDEIRFILRKISAIEALAIRTHNDYVRAEMAGSLTHYLTTPVSPEAEAVVPTKPPVSDAILDATTLCRAVGHADGALVSVEIETMARVLGEVFAVPIGSDATAPIQAEAPQESEWRAASQRLVTNTGIEVRKLLLRGLVGVAAADRRIHEQEVAIVTEIADGLGIKPGYAEALLDGYDPSFGLAHGV